MEENQHSHSDLNLTHYLKADSVHGITFIKGSDQEEFYTYGQLRKEALMVLKNLQQRGLKAGDEVVFQLGENLHVMTLFWACIFGKLIPVPISVQNRNERDKRILSIWQTLNNPFLVHDQETDFGGAFESDRIIPFSGLQEDHGPGEEAQITGSDIAYIQYSSGSTGSPKGVVLTHDNIRLNALDIIEGSAITRKDKTICWMPLTHDMGMIGFHITSMVAGIDQYIIPTDVFVRKPLLWMDKASAHAATVLYSPNFGLKYLLSAYDRAVDITWDLSAVRLIYNGAEPIIHSLCQEFEARLAVYGLSENVILTVYGLAEASVAVSIPTPGSKIVAFDVHRSHLETGDQVVFDPKADEALTFVAVGRPITHCEARISHKGATLGENQVGEIQIRGGNVTAGYYNNTGATVDLFTEDGWVRTGDLGFQSGDNLVITGRSKNMIIINGQNYYPQDLEAISYELEELELGKVAFTSILDRHTDQEKLLAFVMHRGAVAKFIDLCERLRKKILQSLGLLVDSIIPIKRLPKTTSGKVQYFKLREEYLAGVFDGVLGEIEDLSNANKHEQKDLGAELKAILSDLLELTAIDDHLDFFQMGMNSLQALELVSRVNARLNLNISVVDVFESGTLGALLQRLHTSNSPKHQIRRNAAKSRYKPLLPVQKRFWVLNQFEGSDASLIINTSISFKGAFDADVCKKAFDHILDKHQVLRYSFKEIDGELFGVLNQEISSAFTIIDCSDLHDKDAVREVIEREKRRGFDLTQAPLCLCTVLKQAEDEHIMLLQVHHMIADGWSMKVLFNNIWNTYDELIHQKTPAGGLPYQFEDFVETYRSDLEASASDKSYWADQLKEVSGQMTLPYAKGSGSEREFLTSNLSWRIPDGIVAQLDEFSRNHNVTRYTLVLALTNVLLYRLAGSKQLVTGMISSGRNYPELLDQVGCYIRTLPVVTEIAAGDSFLAVTRDISDQQMAALAHDSYSYENMVEDGLWNSLNPLFNVTVLLQNFQALIDLDAAPSELASRDLQYHEGGALSDLQFEFVEEGDQALTLKLSYKRSMFSAADMEQLIRQFGQLSTALLQNPELPVGAHSLLSNDAAAEICGFSEGKKRENGTLSIVELFEKQAMQTPDRVATRFKERELTYEQVSAYVTNAACFLQSNWAIGPEVVVGISMGRSEYPILAMLAVLKAGGAYMAIPTDYPTARVQSMVAQSGARHFLVDQESPLSEMIGDGHIAAMEEVMNDVREEDYLFPVPKPTDLAYVIFTSGSTGAPKGIQITHHSLVDYVQTFKEYFSISSADAVIQQSSIGFDTVVEEIFPVLTAGGKLLITEDGAQNVEELLDLVAVQKATVLSTTPLVIQELNKYPDRLIGLRILISGGDALRSHHIDNLVGRVRIYNTYGPSESTVCVSYHQVDDLQDANTIGKPIANKSVYILDEQKNLLPKGITGELYIGGEGLARGYIGQEQQAFAVHEELGLRLYQTGDLGYWKDDGSIGFKGRKDHQVKINGYRVEPGDIESNIKSLEVIQQVAVLSTLNQKNQNYLIAFYVAETEVTHQTFMAHLSDQLPIYMRPARFIRVPEIPRTSNGKVNQSVLQEMIGKEQGQHEENLPLNQGERDFQMIWQEVLEESQLGVGQNFFEMGGNSIKALQIISRVKRQYDAPLSLKSFFEAPTIREQAKLVMGTAHSENRDSLMKVVGNEFPLTPAQRGLWLLNEYTGDTSAYNISSAFEFTGDFKLNICQSVFNALIARHESLRTTFFAESGEPLQKVHKTEDCQLSIQSHDFVGSPGHETKAEALIYSERNQVFDLGSWPLFQVSVIRMDAARTILNFTVHHIAVDGYSARILIDEFLELYRSFEGNRLPSLVPLTYQFKDYVAWNQERLSDAFLRSHQEYWKDQLTGVRTLEFPLTLKRPAIKTYNGAQVDFWIDETTTKQLKALAESHHTSMYLLFISILKTFIYKNTGINDITIGGPGLGRGIKELHNQVGCYVDVLVLRTSISDEDSIADVLKQEKLNLLECHDHSGYPFEYIVKDLEQNRDQSRSPIFDVRFLYDSGDLRIRDFESKTVVSENLNMQKVEMSVQRTIYDLTFSFSEKEDIKGTIEYNTDLFDRETIELMALRLQTIIDAMREKGEVKVRDIDYDISFSSASKLDDRFTMDEAF